MSGVAPLTAFAVWLARGERGLSSEAMVSVFTGEQVGRYSETVLHHPYDLDDFRRCELLLRQYPFARSLLPMMGGVDPVWAALVAERDDIVALVESKAPGTFDAPRVSGRPPPPCSPKS